MGEVPEALSTVAGLRIVPDYGAVVNGRQRWAPEGALGLGAAQFRPLRQLSDRLRAFARSGAPTAQLWRARGVVVPRRTAAPVPGPHRWAN